METKEKRGYHIIITICGIIMALLMCMVDVYANKYDKVVAEKNEYIEIGNEIENWVLDVVYETDIFDDMTEEESKYIDELWESKEYARYYIELIMLYQKYYGEK